MGTNVFNVFKSYSEGPISQRRILPNVTIELTIRNHPHFSADALLLWKTLNGTTYKVDDKGYIFITGQEPNYSDSIMFWRCIKSEQIGLILMICDDKELCDRSITSAIPKNKGKINGIEFINIQTYDYNIPNVSIQIIEYSLDDDITTYTVIYAIMNKWSANCVPENPVYFVNVHDSLLSLSKTKKIFIYSKNGEGRANLFACYSHFCNLVPKLDYMDPLTILFSLRVDNKLPFHNELQYSFLYITVGYVLFKNIPIIDKDIVKDVCDKFSNLKETFYLKEEICAKESNEITSPQQWWNIFLKNDIFAYSASLFKVDPPRERAMFQGHYVNINKSRSKNNYCYDKTRIVLKCKKNKYDNFYNASWISHKSMNQKYILGESPTFDTMSEFLELIIQENVPLLITPDYYIEDMNNLFPASNKESKFYGNFKLTCEQQYTPIKIEGCFVVRYSVTFSKTNEKHIFDQIQYRRWGNKLLPTEFDLLTSLVDITTKIPNNNPIFVHCIDGWSNSGTFVFVHYMINRIQAEHNVSPSNIIEELRKQRYGIGAIAHQLAYALLTVGSILIKRNIISDKISRSDYIMAKYIFKEFTKTLLRIPHDFNKKLE
uniref:TYR_PHOSPHATASE_2 domain-containing protein n=1 Tax=Parastrongyloides trichosuri TaxID=131310 RepID=A0A0N4ZQA9_PARTI